MKKQINPLRMAAVLTVSLFLFACNTQRKAQRQVAKIQMHNPEVLADAAHKFYPCIIKPLSSVTKNTPDSSLQRIIDSLTAQQTNTQAAAKNAENRADSAIWASLYKKDTACASLLIGLKGTISDLRQRSANQIATISELQKKYLYQIAYPLTITNTIAVSDSAELYVLTRERDNYKNQLSGKDGEIKQLIKSNRNKNIAIAILGIIITFGLFLKFKS